MKEAACETGYLYGGLGVIDCVSTWLPPHLAWLKLGFLIVLTDNITLIKASLHWLMAWFRSNSEILLMTFKAGWGLARSYVTELLTTQVLGSSVQSRPYCKGDGAIALRTLDNLPDETELIESVF